MYMDNFQIVESYIGSYLPQCILFCHSGKRTEEIFPKIYIFRIVWNGRCSFHSFFFNSQKGFVLLRQGPDQ